MIERRHIVALATLATLAAIPATIFAAAIYFGTPNERTCKRMEARGVHARMINGLCYVKADRGIEWAADYERRQELRNAFEAEAKQ